jgi:hypothetical protein
MTVMDTMAVMRAMAVMATMRAMARVRNDDSSLPDHIVRLARHTFQIIRLARHNIGCECHRLNHFRNQSHARGGGCRCTQNSSDHATATNRFHWFSPPVWRWVSSVVCDVYALPNIRAGLFSLA